MKRLFKKLFSLIFIILIGYFCYLHKDWFVERYNNLKGIYYIYKGDQAYSADNMEKTLYYYIHGLELFPQHYEAWFNLGNIYAVHEDYSSAVDAYQHVIDIGLKHKFLTKTDTASLARMNLGIVYSEDLGFFDEAISQFDYVTQLKVLKIWFPWVYNNLKSVKLNRGLAYYNKGVAYRQKALYLPIDQRELYNTFLQNAIDAYTKAAKILKKNSDVYYNRGVAHHLKGEYRDAGLDYCKAIELAPFKFEGHYNLAVLLRGLNHDKEAGLELQKAAILVSESPTSTELQSTYIFNLLNEVTRRFITSQDLNTEKLTPEPTIYDSYTYVNGKVVADEEFDKLIEKNFKTCTGFDYFKEQEEDY